MRKNDGAIIFSPTDVSRYLESPFASWMERFALEHPEECAARDTQDPFLEVLQNKGYAHEDNVEKQFRSLGKSVTKVEERGDKGKEATLSAMKQGVDIIVQANLHAAPFAGYADFLIKIPGKSDFGDYLYSVWDTKLSTSVKPTFIIQLCCYVEMLESIQGAVADEIGVILGNGEKESFLVRDFYAYYQLIKEAFLRSQNSFDSTKQPDPASSVSYGNWSDYANTLLIEQDHLFQVARITRSQIKRLNDANVHTLTQLAQYNESHVTGLNPFMLPKLISQAMIQLESRGLDVPKFQVLPHAAGEHKGLALLPPPTPQDIYFDIEGYPLVEGGLEYLWGSTYFDNEGHRCFKDFWAHDEEEEKQTFIDFITWVYSLWLSNKQLHIFHYANYEIAACRKLMSRYGVCEHEVDELLRNEVFVDLYKVVSSGLLIGEPRYSIKNVEHLYRESRSTDVGTGGDSVVVYDEWRDSNATGGEGRTWETSERLKSIRDYNIDDCDSTQELAQWLEERKQEQGITYLGKEDQEETVANEDVEQLIILRDRLLAKAEAAKNSNDVVNAQLIENLAWLLEFPRRERKPLYWKLFDRLGSTYLELMEDLDCLGGCIRTSAPAFKPTDRARNMAYEYSFDIEQEFKGATNRLYVLGIEAANGRALTVKYLEEHSDLEAGRIVVQSSIQLPSVVSFVPDDIVPAGHIPRAIQDVVSRFDESSLGECAILDFLRRSRPRIRGGNEGPIASNELGDKQLAQITKAVQNLDNSYLPIQGPPGTGKTYTGKHIIAELVASGAKVGISSNSHKAIYNLLSGAAKLCIDKGVEAEVVCTKEPDDNFWEYSIGVTENAKLAEHAVPGCILGATAWGFARDEMVGKLDYLFVDEAGQVSVANLVAMSRSTRNLVVMGDQMQLGQPSQASHPAESGLSILDYLLHETPTIDEDMGVFLGTTYRMHPRLNDFISDHIYEGKLSTDSANVKRVLAGIPKGSPLNGIESGIVFIPVEHEGNTQGADEEVEQIEELVAQLLKANIVQEDGSHRRVSMSDILFVAPYNLQRVKLQQALGSDAKVGTVDKFQGQEAPIVILSMCSSDANESSRGLDFLLDRKRLNVALSRAMSLAIVVGNPSLALTHVTNVKQMRLLNLFSAIVLNRSNV